MINDTKLTEIIRDEMSQAIERVLRIHADSVAQALTARLLSDEKFKTRIDTLMMKAFEAALEDLEGEGK